MEKEKVKIDSSIIGYYIILLVIFILIGAMLIVYFEHFTYGLSDRLSDNSNDWGNFGNYIGPVATLFSIAILVFTLMIQDRNSKRNIMKLKEQIKQQKTIDEFNIISKMVENYENEIDKINSTLSNGYKGKLFSIVISTFFESTNIENWTNEQIKILYPLLIEHPNTYESPHLIERKFDNTTNYKEIKQGLIDMGDKLDIQRDFSTDKLKLSRFFFNNLHKDDENYFLNNLIENVFTVFSETFIKSNEMLISYMKILNGFTNKEYKDILFNSISGEIFLIFYSYIFKYVVDYKLVLESGLLNKQTIKLFGSDLLILYFLQNNEETIFTMLKKENKF